MNERIKELETQCWAVRKWGQPWFDSEKFAELIILECSAFVNLKLETETVEGSMIQEHFGGEMITNSGSVGRGKMTDSEKRDRIVAIIDNYTIDMEGYSYCGSNFGVSKDDYEIIAADIMKEFNIS